MVKVPFRCATTTLPPVHYFKTENGMMCSCSKAETEHYSLHPITESRRFILYNEQKFEFKN